MTKTKKPKGKPKKNKGKEINYFSIGLLVGSFLSMPILLAIFVQNILVKIVGLIFLFFFIMMAARSFNEMEEENDKKK